MYRECRINAGLTQENAANKINISQRALQHYENGETIPPAGVVLAMSKVYKQPYMTQHYCREHCDIGRAYSYVVLNNVNLSPQNIMLKLISEFREAELVLSQMVALTVNKETSDDFTDNEMAEFKSYLHEFLDVEHTVETLKISLNRYINVDEMIREHNQKCIDRNYCVKKKKTEKFSQSFNK